MASLNGPLRRRATVGRLEVVDRRPDLPGQGYGARGLSEISALIVHHSATPTTTTAEAIARYHIDANGWPGIGYHLLVFADGRIEYVGGLSTERYHIRGHNRRSVGICLIGNFAAEPPPAPQLAATSRLLAEIQLALGWFVPIYGHRELNDDTACPGETFLRGWRQGLITRQFENG